MHQPQKHFSAVMQALFVTLLWSSSWVLIKFGLKGSIPAVTFAGLRYSLAFLCLIPFVLFNNESRRVLRNLDKSSWLQLTVLGIVFYALTQGTQFISLSLLPAASVSLFLNLTPAAVAVLGSYIIKENLSIAQWGGIILSAAGVLLYFLPISLHTYQISGLAAALVCVSANSASSLLGRRANQTGLPPLIITFVSMGTGALVLIITGITMQGTGVLTSVQWMIIVWLAVVNTAFAFWLWNHTLRTLSAVESSILNSTMLPQIAVLAWILLDEPLSIRQISGLLLAGTGAVIVQLWRRKPKEPIVSGKETNR